MVLENFTFEDGVAALSNLCCFCLVWVSYSFLSTIPRVGSE